MNNCGAAARRIEKKAGDGVLDVPQISTPPVGATRAVAGGKMQKNVNKRCGSVRFYGSAVRYSLYSVLPVSQKPKRLSQNKRQSVQAEQSPIRL